MARDPGSLGGESTRGDETRARILAVAMDAFARDGFDGTSVRSIASRCGLSYAAVFYYFPTKRHLLEALWSEGPSGEFPRAEPAAQLTPERIADLVIATLDEMTGATSPRLQLELMVARVLAQTGSAPVAAAPVQAPAAAVQATASAPEIRSAV